MEGPLNHSNPKHVRLFEKSWENFFLANMYVGPHIYWKLQQPSRPNLHLALGLNSIG
jgi:hypothetical protein